MLNVVNETTKKTKHLTQVPAIDHHHEKTTIMLLCTTLAPNHQLVQKKPNQGKKRFTRYHLMMHTMHNKRKSQGGISRIKTKMHGWKNFYLATMLYHCKGVEQKLKLQQLITM